MEGDDGSGASEPLGHVGQEGEPPIGLGDHRVHRARLLPHGESGVCKILLVREAEAVLAHEDVPGTAALVDGDVLGEDVKHALDLGDVGTSTRLEGEEGGANTGHVRAIERPRRGRQGNGIDQQQNRNGERDRD